MNDLTSKGGKDTLSMSILDFIINYNKEYGFPPTYREIAAHFKISLSSVANHVKKLVGSGTLQKVPKRARSVILSSTLPIRGFISQSGVKIYDSPLYFIKVDGIFSNRAYCLVVEGDSFINQLIKDGDILVVDNRVGDSKKPLFIKKDASGIRIDDTAPHDEPIIGIIRCLIRPVEHHPFISQNLNRL